ncbi:MAG: DUF434 domain-containing protein [Planctomycetota bacterium]|nr:MAG: DUF434 domain-containing protein [Planctomycetota bacterium]
MPDRRRHRGPHPEDAALFAAEMLPRLRTAAVDFCYLLDRGYAEPSALKLVGDRYALRARQRTALARACCTTEAVTARTRRVLDPSLLAGRELWIDGYNLLTTIEAALAGGVLLVGRDGTLRDLASVHGSYRKVAETEPALRHIGAHIADLKPARVVWLLDRPVSNSGRLAALIREVGTECVPPWTVRLEDSPDRILRGSPHAIVTADSGILDAPVRWLNLARRIAERLPEAWIVDLFAD